MTNHIPDAHDSATVGGGTDLQAELAALRRRIDDLEADLSARSSATSHDAPADVVDDDRLEPRSTRRRLLGAAAAAAGAAAAGAAVVASPSRVAASTGNGLPLELGVVNVASQTTELRYNFPIGGNPRTGVLAVNDGVWLPQTPGAGFDEASSQRGAIVAYAGNDATHGIYGQTNSGARGSSGGRFVGEGALTYGLVTSGRRATIYLDKPVSGTTSPPPDRGDAHNDGELTIDANNDLWLCVEAGDPGVWRKLTGPNAAGAFHAVAPVRVFDSRLAGTPGAGRFNAGSSRVVSVKDGRDVNTGLVGAANVVPKGATAVTYNLTVTNTDAGGFAFIAPSETSDIGASSINWSEAGVTIANGGVVKLGGDRQLRVFCEVSGADVILDITGYYR